MSDASDCRQMVCVSCDRTGDFGSDDLTVGQTYTVLGPVDSHGMLRVIDDSGEAYLYPARLFAESPEAEGSAQPKT